MMCLKLYYLLCQIYTSYFNMWKRGGCLFEAEAFDKNNVIYQFLFYFFQSFSPQLVNDNPQTAEESPL